tara:strand:+ start:264 stop:722 length:459 start_codon:yes stop_codon:yes gene_type:complete
MKTNDHSKITADNFIEFREMKHHLSLTNKQTFEIIEWCNSHEDELFEMMKNIIEKKASHYEKIDLVYPMQLRVEKAEENKKLNQKLYDLAVSCLPTEPFVIKENYFDTPSFCNLDPLGLSNAYMLKTYAAIWLSHHFACTFSPKMRTVRIVK